MVRCLQRTRTNKTDRSIDRLRMKNWLSRLRIGKSQICSVAQEAGDLGKPMEAGDQGDLPAECSLQENSSSLGVASLFALFTTLTN